MLRMFFLIVFASCVLAQGPTKEIMNVFRLPNDTEPLSYTLSVKPIIILEKNLFAFNGNVTIRIRAKTSTKELTLNAVDLEINKIVVTDEKTPSNSISLAGYNLVANNEQLKIRFEEPGLIVGQNYSVQILYSGSLRNDMTGFYKSSYLDKETNKTKYVLHCAISLVLKSNGVTGM